MTTFYMAFSGAWYDETIEEHEIDGGLNKIIKSLRDSDFGEIMAVAEGVWGCTDPCNTGTAFFSFDKEKLQEYLMNRPKLIITFEQ